MGVRHPTDPTTKVPLVMTTDLVVDTMQNGRLVTLARAVKPAAELEKPRVLEKLEIERRWWTAQGIDWGILTERDIPMTMASAIFWVHEYGHLDGLSQPYPGYFAEKAALIRRELPNQPGSTPLQRFCRDMDALLGLEAGTALFLIRHLLAVKSIRCDMNQPLDDTVPLHRFEILTTTRAKEAG